MNYEDMEATILKGFMQDRQIITLALTEGFDADLCAEPASGRLCRAVLDLYTRGGAVDPVSVRNYLESRGLLTADMDRYLQAVVSLRTPDAGRVMAYVEALKNRDSRERLRAVTAELEAFLAGSAPARGDLGQLTTHAIHELMELQKRRTRTRIRPASELVSALVSETETRSGDGQARLLGYSLSPFDRLTALLSGLRRGFYYGIAGAPRRGKTNLTLQLATYVAANHRVPVLFYSWEQSSRVLAARLLAKETGIDPVTILTGEAADQAPLASRLHAARERMARYAPYVFLVEAGRQDTLSRIRAHAYNLMQEFQTDEVVLFFDYLQKIPLDEPVEDWKARTDLISTALAELSLELNVPVVAISPLDKEGCRLDEKPLDDEAVYSPYQRPTMHHSVGSGDLEYDLDVAMVLAKDWKATGELRQLLESQARSAGVDPDSLPQVDIVNLYVDKNRDAPESAASIVQYAFFVTLNTFVELDYKLEKEYRPEFRSHGKLQTIYTHLRESGILPLAAPARR